MASGIVITDDTCIRDNGVSAVRRGVVRIDPAPGVIIRGNVLRASSDVHPVAARRSVR